MEKLNENFVDFLRLLNERKVKYLIIGGYAVAFHGFVRATGDLDIFVERSEENAARIVAAFEDFGFADSNLTRQAFLLPGKIVRLGVPPLRVEVLNDIDGVQFSDCYENRIEDTIDGLQVAFIDRDHLIKNKESSGRLKDLADVHELTKSGRK